LTANAGAELYSGDTKLFERGKQPQMTYVDAAAGRHEFELRHAGKGTAEPIAKNSEGLRRDAHYTVIAFDDENGKATLRVINDEEAAPANRKAKIRVIDAAARAGDFDLYFAGRNDRIAGEPMMGDVSGWKEVNVAQEPLEIRIGDDNAKRAPVPGVRLEPGKLYTFVVTDGQKGEQPLHVTALQNEPTKLPVATPPAVPPTT
jgi:hypothetical protein